jgi:TonB family protein
MSLFSPSLNPCPAGAADGRNTRKTPSAGMGPSTVAMGGLVVALTVGCAVGMTVEEAFETPAPLESRCNLASDDQVPEVPAAVDAEAVGAWAQAALSSEGEASEAVPSIVLSIQRGESAEAGDASWVRVMASDLDEDASAALRAEVERSLPPLGEEDPGASYRLRIDLAPEPSFHVAPSVHCAPAVANREQVFERLVELPPEVFSGGTGRAVILFRVAEDVGTEVYELEESTGNPELDRAILRVARTARFEPGHTDGFTITTYNRIPFDLSARR